LGTGVGDDREGTPGWTLVTSRKPDDLDAFNQAAISAFVSA
jgi:hypothetical protein